MVLGHGQGGIVTELVAARPKTRIFPGERDQVGHARKFVGRVLDGNALADDAALLTSELATNAVLHTASGQGGTFAVAVRQQATLVRVEVWDAGAVTAPVVRSADQERESGIITKGDIGPELEDRFGVRPREEANCAA